jgi:hypothetical protein
MSECVEHGLRVSSEGKALRGVKMQIDSFVVVETVVQQVSLDQCSGFPKAFLILRENTPA